MINKGKEQHQVRGEAKYIKQQQYKIEHRFFTWIVILLSDLKIMLLF